MSRLARRAGAAVLVTAALAGVAGCGPQGRGAGALENATPVRTTKVDLPKSYRFDPVVVRVDTGATVTWTNHDDFTHDVQFESGGDTKRHVLKPGDHVSIRFAKAGTFHYRCTFHPRDMRGEVVVV